MTPRESTDGSRRWAPGPPRRGPSGSMPGRPARTVTDAGEWASRRQRLGLRRGAVGVALLGTLRDSWRLTALATGALVVFTTCAGVRGLRADLQGAWLFVVLGLIFLGTGFGFDRARQRLVAAVTTRKERTDEAPHGDRDRRRGPAARSRPASRSAPRLSATAAGEETSCAWRPVDPIDPFRGAYVDLSIPT